MLSIKLSLKLKLQKKINIDNTPCTVKGAHATKNFASNFAEWSPKSFHQQT